MFYCKRTCSIVREWFGVQVGVRIEGEAQPKGHASRMFRLRVE